MKSYEGVPVTLGAVAAAIVVQDRRHQVELDIAAQPRRYGPETTMPAGSAAGVLAMRRPQCIAFALTGSAAKQS
jgi:hypothetical protein